MRRNSESEFRAIFAETKSLGKEVHGNQFELKLPWISSRQMHRANIPTTSAEATTICLFNEFVSHVMVELEERFDSMPVQIGLAELLLSVPKKNLTTKCHKLFRRQSNYANNLSGVPTVPTEYQMWIRKWQQNATATKMSHALKQCDLLLKIALTLPFMSCESERSFSKLKLVKTSLNLKMSLKRLSSLSLMKITWERWEDLKQHHMKNLARSFARRHACRMKLPFLLTN